MAVKDSKEDTLLLAFCYMPHDDEAPPVELRRLIDAAQKMKTLLVIGTDTNAHHTVRGSSDTIGVNFCTDKQSRYS